MLNHKIKSSNIEQYSQFYVTKMKSYIQWQTTKKITNTAK